MPLPYDWYAAAINHVIAKSSAHWCGNLHRFPPCPGDCHGPVGPRNDSVWGRFGAAHRTGIVVDGRLWEGQDPPLQSQTIGGCVDPAGQYSVPGRRTHESALRRRSQGRGLQKYFPYKERIFYELFHPSF
jgi:hypothetical protein